MRRLAAVAATILCACTLPACGHGTRTVTVPGTTTGTVTSEAPRPVCVVPVGRGSMGDCNPLQGVQPPLAGVIAPGSSRGGFQGVDLSENNGTVSFSYLKAHGITFVYVKAEEDCRTDSELAHDVSEAARERIPLGLYDYFRPGFSASATASCLARLLRYAVARHVTMLPAVFDVESFSEGPVCGQLAAATADLRRDYPGVRVGRYGSSFNSPDCGGLGQVAWPADWLVSFPANLPGFGAFFNWQYFGPRFGGRFLSEMDRDKGAPGIFKLEFSHAAPSTLELKRRLYAAYRRRAFFNELRDRHTCATRPSPRPSYRRACNAWRAERRDAQLQISKLHAHKPPIF